MPRHTRTHEASAGACRWTRLRQRGWPAAFATAAALLSLTSGRLAAQQVVPAVSSVTKAAPGTNYTASFTVSNTNLAFGSATADTFALTCTKSGIVSACRGAPATIVVPRGGGSASASTNVAVTYDLSTVGGGTLGLLAQVIRSGEYAEGDMSVTGSSTGGSASTTPPVVSLEPGNVDSLEATREGSQLFRVRNVANVSDTYSFTCGGASSPLSCAYVSVDNATLEPGKDMLIRVTVDAGTTTPGAPPVSRSVTLTATGLAGATASASAPVRVFRQPVLSVAYTASDRARRSDCPVVGGGVGSGAVACGDLLFAHAFPAYRTMNETRGLTLLYNSATAKPLPLVVADFTFYPGDAVGDQLAVDVARTSGSTASTTVYFDTVGVGAGAGAPQTRRMVVPIDADAFGMTSTGAYPVQVTLRRRVSGAWQTASTANTRLLVVDRRASPFGAGWWPAGVERLYPDANGAMLVLGDGSPVYFTAVTGGYRAPPGEYSALSAVAGVGYKRVLSGQRVTVWYGLTGLVDSVTDNNPSRNKAAYAYSGTNPTAITDAAGKSVTFSYTNGRVSGITIPAVAAIRLATSMPAGATYATLDTIVDPDSLAIPFGYASGSARMTSSKERGTGLVQYAYDAVSGTVSTIDPPPGTSTYTAAQYPTRTFLAWQRAGAPASGTGSTTSPARTALRDTVRLVVSWSAGATGTATAAFKVDRFGAPVMLQRPLGATTTIERDSAGQPVHVSTSRGAEAWQTWDARGNLTRSITRRAASMTAPNSSVFDTTTYDYSTAWDAVTGIHTPDTANVSIHYDAYGRRDQMTDALGRVTTFTYTPRGQLETITEPLDTVPTRYTYDPTTFNLLKIANKYDSTQYVYATNASDVQTVIDPVGARTDYVYDAVKRTKSVSQPNNGTGDVYQNSATYTSPRVVQYTYDDVNRITTMTDPAGKRSTWERDDVGRVVKRCVLNLTQCEQFGYQDGLNLTYETHRGDVIRQNFDLEGRVTERLLGMYGADDDITFTYDDDGNATAINNKYSHISREYDAYGHLVHENQGIRQWGGMALDGSSNPARSSSSFFREVEQWHDYDAMGRRVRTFVGGTARLTRVCIPAFSVGEEMDLNCLHPFGVVASDTIRYLYTKTGALARIVNDLWQTKKGSGARSWIYDRDAKNRVTLAHVPTNTTGTYDVGFQYDDGDRVIHQWDPIAGHDWRITRDALGRVRQASVGDLPADIYGYDDVGQLVYENHSSSSHVYVYDLAGNRAAGWTDFQAQYNSVGQLIGETRAGCTTPSSFQYDMSGNQIVANTPCRRPIILRRSHFDLGDRMDSTFTSRIVPSSSGDATSDEGRRFWYDGLGRRILMKSSNPNADDWGVWRYWWLDDNVAVKTWNAPDSSVIGVDYYWPQLNRDSSKTLIGTGGWFYYGPGADNVLASWNTAIPQSTKPRRLFYRDYRGSVVQVINADGSMLALSPSTYGAFGDQTGSTNATASTGPAYNGAESNGGLVYMRNRWYDPNSGRFTQQDPIGYAGGINLYGYTGNDPVNYSDPFGLCGHKGEDPCPSTMIGALQQLGRMAPAMNKAVAGFLPATAAVAATGVGGAAAARALLAAAPAVPMLSQGSGREMLGEAVQALRDMPASARVDAFRNFAQQIEGATQGAWQAAEQQAVNATIFAGKAGEAIVFNAGGQAFRGNIGNADQFTRTANGLVANFDQLKQIVH